MNTERPERQLDPEKLQVVQNAVVLKSTEDVLMQGITGEEFYTVASQVSRSINEYNDSNPNEMLPKSPEDIVNHFQEDLSCLVVSKVHGEWQFLHHSALYPLLENGEDDVLGIQIVELGAAITHSDFRNGYGLGTLGAKVRVGMLDKFRDDGKEAFGLSTVKRIRTGYLWRKQDVHPVSFWHHPYTSFLTNSCENSSERFGHDSCGFRRTLDESTPEVLQVLFEHPDRSLYIPCTLLATDHELVMEFERRCQVLHQSMGGTPLGVGSISVEDYAHATAFFDSVAALAKTNG